jgi:hypothetical protein
MTVKSEPLPMHLYEVRPRKDKRGVDLISDALPFGRLWHAGLPIISAAVSTIKVSAAFSSGLALPSCGCAPATGSVVARR